MTTLDTFFYHNSKKQLFIASYVFFCKPDLWQHASTTFHGIKKLGVGFGAFHLVPEKFHGINGIHRTQKFAQYPDLVQFFRREQQLFLAGGGAVDVYGGEHAAVGQLAVKINFRIAGAINNSSISSIYDLVIFNDNSYGIEALIYGVKCFELDLFENSLDERLIYFDTWRYRINAKGLKKLRDSLESGSFDKLFDREAISDYINYLYSPYTGNLSVVLKAINAQNVLA